MWQRGSGDTAEAALRTTLSSRSRFRSWKSAQLKDAVVVAGRRSGRKRGLQHRGVAECCERLEGRRRDQDPPVSLLRRHVTKSVLTTMTTPFFGHIWSVRDVAPFDVGQCCAALETVQMADPLHISTKQ